MTVELLTSCRTPLGVDRGRPRYALDCSIAALWHRVNDGPVQTTDPTFELQPSGYLRTRNTPYELTIGMNGERWVYPDKGVFTRYLRLPAPALMRNLQRRVEGNTVRYMAARYDVLVIAGFSGVRFKVILKQPVPFDSITLDVDDVGLGLAGLLDRKGGMGIPSPSLEDSSPDPIVRPLKWSYANGQLTVGWDPTGLTYPVTFRNVTLDLSVGASLDDTYVRRQTTTDFKDTTTGMPFGNINATNYGYGGSMRWTGVNIPAGASILVAYITYIAQSTQSGTTCSATIAAENASNPAAPTTYADHTGRTRAASVAYTNVAAQTAGDSIQTPSIVTTIQDVVDTQGGTGDALQVFIEDAAAASSTGAWRGISSWDHATYAPPAIHIEYDEAAADQEPALIGGKLTQSILMQHLVR